MEISRGYFVVRPKYCYYGIDIINPHVFYLAFGKCDDGVGVGVGVGVAVDGAGAGVAVAAGVTVVAIAATVSIAKFVYF
ncbi:hypothetical protein [Paenibacillus woosongensis]|uniref:Transmembrane protein n=1 Tax=Paenibacillus woosongensis TaxID=307580 RepID=A0ABQ4MJT7_9BACL|nr:hypothetical protein [Paenibacillus woosongensis]GIP56255.1 hypothetical protein J15TS10_00690 [Paenibacillus woosongensis]